MTWGKHELTRPVLSRTRVPSWQVGGKCAPVEIKGVESNRVKYERALIV